MSKEAWKVRDNSYLYGDTKVGVSLLTSKDYIFVGCNIEHRYRCHDIHAEVNLISQMISAGEREIKAILIAAKRNYFTPCGSCMDWIIQFAADNCIVGIQSVKGGEIRWFNWKELMPHYPR